MSDSDWKPPIFILQCVECNNIVADSSNLTATDSVVDDDDEFHVRQVCHVVRADASKNNKKKSSSSAKKDELMCAQCDSVVGRPVGADGLASLNRVCVRRIDLSSERGVKRVPSESLERVVRAQQRQAKVKLLELSKKAAALDGRIATLDAQAAILRRRRDENDSDDDDDNSNDDA
jgi:hypothetical protein